jgi:DNA-binding transcriptional LysR family regulator
VFRLSAGAGQRTYAGAVSGDIRIRQLEYVIALARERHFGRAAAACHVSQSALSDAVRKLEVELGIVIVERGWRFTGFTAEGGRVIEWAQRILAKRDALRVELTRMHEGLTATLRIGVIPTAVAVTPLLVEAFHARYPQARVQVATASAQQIVRGLADFDLDAGISYLDGDGLDGGFGAVRLHELYHERYVLLTPVDGPFGRHTAAGWADVAGLRLCALTPGMQNRRILDRVLAGVGARLEPVLEADTVDALYVHLRTARWSSVLPHSWLSTFPVPPGMTAVALPDFDRPAVIGVITGAREPASLVAAALLEAVGEVDVRAELDHARHVALTAARRSAVEPAVIPAAD